MKSEPNSNNTLMHVKGFGKLDEDKKFARVAREAAWGLQFPTVQIAIQRKNHVLVSLIEQTGKLRFAKIVLQE